MGLIRMIGVYDYTVLATYLALLLGLGGIYAAFQARPLPAMLALMLAGLLDAFDGRIARTKKDRSEQEKRFGIQIDSLNDLVCFGVLPAAIGWSMDCERFWFLATMAFFVLCALIRLAYFNVSEEERQDKTSENRHYYLGVPVTASAFVMPLFYLLALYLGRSCAAFYALGAFVLGILYITPLHVRKIGLRGVALAAALGAAEFFALLHMLRA